GANLLRHGKSFVQERTGIADRSARARQRQTTGSTCWRWTTRMGNGGDPSIQKNAVDGKGWLRVNPLVPYGLIWQKSTHPMMTGRNAVGPILLSPEYLAEPAELLGQNLLQPRSLLQRQIGQTQAHHIAVVTLFADLRRAQSFQLR